MMLIIVTMNEEKLCLRKTRADIASWKKEAQELFLRLQTSAQIHE
jgi:hypothetical protein